MKTKNILTLIIAALIFVACNQNSKEKEISTDDKAVDKVEFKPDAKLKDILDKACRSP